MLMSVTADEADEFHGHSSRHAQHAAGQTEGDPVRLRCAQRKQTTSASVST